ncbi:MAG TPA: adenylate/guanylate cyclase domain-containing protein [Candidatus Cybelea sp.]|nr:adenylate/guanylate cyclase domain-containing protein [Candidatus Cybelea sp.]
MAQQRVERKLTAIIAADVAGYSRLMGMDEEGTLAQLNAHRRELIDPKIKEHRGRIVKTTGDGILIEFASVVDAVRCALDVQQRMIERNASVPKERRIEFRVGINIGDIIVEGDDIFGDGVNVAARLEQLAEPGAILVSRNVRNEVRDKLASAFEDLGEREVKNIARPVRIYRLRIDKPIEPVADKSSSALALPDKPSIAVLPFMNMSGDVEQEYFADGITEDIITALSKQRWFLVIARNSTFAYKGKQVDTKQVARELGIRYLLEGSVRKAGDRIRITAQLIEAATGAHLWAERYDRNLADIFAVQDDITESVVGAIEPELLNVERQRAARKSTDNMDAFDHYLRAIWSFYQFTLEEQVRAEQHARRAIELDPTFAQGHLSLARILNFRIWYGWSEGVDSDLQNGYAAARRAAELDDKDPYVHYILAWYALLKREHESALAEVQKSIDLSPNFALGYFILGSVRTFVGQFDEANEAFQRAMRLSAHESLTFFFAHFLALAQYGQGRYADAAKTARQGIAIRPAHVLYGTLAACYGQLGQLDEARAALAEMRRLMPKDADRLWDLTHPYADPVHRAHVIEGLRKAGLER